MKKILKFLLIIIIVLCCYYGYQKVSYNVSENNRIKEAKKGWYIEVLIDNLNVRKEPKRSSAKIDELQKGDIFEVVDYNTKDSSKYWYQIKLRDGSKGWVANPKALHYIKDYNGKVDVATPTIKFKEDEYTVISIDKINYKHLEIWDDRDDYKVTHTVFHEVKPEENIDQYWIQYVVTDISGKSASKVQKIIFENKPSEDQVEPFENLKR